MLGGFLFRKDDVHKKVSVLSGGEKSRLALARLLVNPPNLLLMDEPTTHLDIPSIDALVNALKQYEGTFIFISHDVYFIRALAQTVLHVHSGRLTPYAGNYDYYLEKSKATQRPRRADRRLHRCPARSRRKPATAAPAPPVAKKPSPHDLKKLRSEVSKLEQRVSELETKQVGDHRRAGEARDLQPARPRPAFEPRAECDRGSAADGDTPNGNPPRPNSLSWKSQS